MTCSRLLVLGALIGGGYQLLGAPVAVAQTPAQSPAPAAKAPTAKAPAAAGAKAPAAPAVKAPVAAVPAKYPFGLPEAKVRSVRNQPKLTAGTESRPASKDDIVQPGQLIETGAGAGAELGFADGTRFLAGENTTLSIYGVAPVAPAPKPGAKVAAKPKAKPFKPGSNTLTRGEVIVIVPAPPPPAPAAPAVGGKAVAAKKPAKPAAPKIPQSAIVATPVGKVSIYPGGMARISVEPSGLTRVSVYEGTGTVAGAKGKPIVLAAGTGSRIADVKTAPVAPAALPAAPVLSGVQRLAFTTGAPVDVKGSYAGATGSAPASSWHIQVAQDAQFEQLVADLRVPATEARLVPMPLAPGDYAARVSAVNADGAEGAASAPEMIKVAKVTLWPGAEGRRAAVLAEGRGLFCGLDGAALAPVGQPVPLSPAQEHTLRCALSPNSTKAEEIAEYKVSAEASGPLMKKVEPAAAAFTETEGSREVRLSLSDAAGNPVSGAKVEVEGTGGAKVEPVKEIGQTGTYSTTVRWPKGSTGQGLSYKVNGTEAFASALPDALPPQPTADQPKETDDAGKREMKRFNFEMSAMPLVHVDIPRGVFAVGAGIELGGRIRLSHGGLAFALRPQYEYFSPAPGVSHVVAVGLPITYRLRNVDADWVPYLGVLPQFVAEYSFLARDGVAIEDGAWRTQYGLGGILGSELRLNRGAVFVEGGYRHIFGREDRENFASLKGVFANLGYRLNF